MRLATPHTLLILALLLGAGPLVQAQTVLESNARAVAAPVCLTPPAPYNGEASVPAPAPLRKRQAGSVTVNFLGNGDSTFSGAYNCRNWPAGAQTAFAYAAGIWDGQIDTPVDVVVDACWTNDLGLFTLGGAAANSIIRNFASAPVPNTWYPIALANALEGTDFNGAGSAEIVAVFNANPFLSTWYFGTDANPPSGQQDFVTTVLHEIGHGLGFAGIAGINDGTGRCTTAPANQGCISNGGSPYGFDLFTEDGGGVSLRSDPPYADPSTNLAAILTGNPVGGNSGVFFNGPTAGTQQLYTPASYAGGSTYSHFNTATYPGELMKHALSTGQAIHDPGIALSVLEDIGWSQAIPVELTAFDALRDGADVLLQWATASETNNSGFEVQLRQPGAADFAVVDFVDGAGTTSEAQAYVYRLPDLAPGTYAFRLRQVDFDGRAEVFPEVEATVEVAGTHWVASAYPNPFTPEATVEFAVRRSAPVRAVLYDLLGRPVQTLYEGIPDANAPVRARIDGRALASGTYVLQVVGEDFRETQRVTVVR